MTNNNILKKCGYWAEFERMSDGKKFQYQVWMKLEAKLFARYGVHRFETIDAFKKAKSRLKINK